MQTELHQTFLRVAKFKKCVHSSIPKGHPDVFCLNTSNVGEGESRKESGHTICIYLQVATLPNLPYRFIASSVAQSKFISSI